MSLSFEIEQRDTGDSGSAGGGTVRVILHGRIDRDAGAVMDAIDAQSRDASVVELDFADVDYINSSGIALIVGLLARARSRKATVRGSGLTPHYQHIFDITRLSDFIEIVQPTAG